MTLDVRTLIVLMGVGHVLQMVVLSLQYAVHRSYRGIGWWLLWSASVATGSLFMRLREVPGLRLPSILLQNAFLVLGVTCLYVGLMRFHDRFPRRFVLPAILVPFFAGLGFFTLARDEVGPRSVVISGTLAVVALVTAWELHAVRAASTRVTAGFLTAVLVGHGTFFAWRTAKLVAGTGAEDIFVPSAFNLAAFVDGFVVANLLTFGLILMVSQRTHAEMAEARDQFRLLFETSPDAALITRAADGVCRNVNEGFERLSGYGREEVLGRSTRDLDLYVDPDAREKVVAVLREKGEVTSAEIVFRKKDGSLLFGSMSARIILLGEEPHVISVTRDVTERKLVEEDLARSATEIRELNAGLEKRVAARTAELTEKNRELESFVSSIAHDLRAPLRAIDGFSGILEEEHADRLDPEGLRLLSKVRGAAERMDRLIRDLLEYARAGTAELHRGEVNMRTLALEAFQDVVPGEARGGISFVVEDLPAASGDAALLRVVFHQLLANAVKFTAARPERRVDVRAVRNEGVAWYEVADSGVGFDPALEQKLFGMFQRLHSRDGFEGTGIGLAIVKRIVERHGGRVRATGEPGRGAVFAFAIAEAGGADA